jgi:hypothetical protein
VPAAVNVPPFAFSGRGGRSKYISPIDYLGFEPRFGFAWQPKKQVFGFDLEKRSVVVRGGFGISHAPLTGNNRSPNPDFGGFVNVATLANGSTGTADPTTPIRLSGNAPLQGTPLTLDQSLGTDANGLVYLNSLGIPAVAVDLKGGGKVPYAQNWNLSVQFEPIRGLGVEVAYVGNKGTHLYLPQININQRDINLITSLESGGVDLTGTIPDPLGRRNLQGAVITISRASVLTPFVGFDPLSKYFDPSASSIRHAWYIDVQRRIARGLSFTANYTHSKSLDDASDASPDTRVLSTGQARGQVSLGAPLSSDRAISTYDVANNFNSTLIWDLPIGRSRRFLNNAPKAVNTLLGGWVVSSVFRMPGGTPFLPFITDPNRLGGVLFNRVVRPDIVQGVPLRNPLWKRSCPTGNGCEPFINPAAFMRPVEGTLGNAPRSLNIRPPRQEYFDFSLSKDFPWPFSSNEGKRKINFRVDLINAFNHPNFRYFNTGNTPSGLGTFPTELTSETVNGVTQPITAAEYNAWATFNNQPLSTTPAGAALLATVRGNVNAVRLPPRSGSVSGALPLDFFHVLLPQGFATRDPLSFDIRTLDGFRLYRIRQTYDTNFGTLTGVFPAQNPRYIQFGLKIVF